MQKELTDFDNDPGFSVIALFEIKKSNHFQVHLSTTFSTNSTFFI
jgi:hypothetical protein